MTSRLPFVSIIIPTKNAGGRVAECLESISRLAYPQDLLETIVVDGASTDGTARIAARFGAIVLQGSAEGPTMARMTGVAHAKGSIIAFTDADATVDAYWLANAVNILEHEPTVSVVGGPVLHPPQGLFATAAQTIFDLLARAKLTNNSARIPARRTMEKIGHVNFIVRKQTLVDLLPWSWKGYGGDVAMCDAIRRRKGGAIVQDPSVVVSHYKRSDPVSLFRELFKWGNGRGRMGMRKITSDLPNCVMGLSIPTLAIALATTTPFFGFAPVAIAVASSAVGAAAVSVLSFATTHSLAVAAVSPFAFFAMVSGWSAGFTIGIVSRVFRTA